MLDRPFTDLILRPILDYFNDSVWHVLL